MKLAIVAIGYNRVESLKRLLQSLSVAYYDCDKVDLFISVDNSGTDVVLKYAESFCWGYGNKIIKSYPKRLGLRQHVLTCGDLVYGYDGLAVFEDDIYVAPSFYSYMKQAISMYANDCNIAGISLYSHLWSEQHQRPFSPEKKEYDNYFLQYAQSWGQIWMPKQWKEFKDWYKKNSGDIVQDSRTPQHITKWPETSWLKYHIKFCIENNKYFVYPYYSFTTNFVEIGQHCKTSNNPSGVYYDAFFERKQLGKELSILEGDLTVDLYNSKEKDNSRYLLSSARLDYKVLHSYGLKLRPHEMNIIKGIDGEDIFLYDTSEKASNKFKSDWDFARWYYDSRVFDYKYLLRILVKILNLKIRNRIKRK